MIKISNSWGLMQEYMERESADRSKVRPVIYTEVFVMKDTLKSNDVKICIFNCTEILFCKIGHLRIESLNDLKL